MKFDARTEANGEKKLAFVEWLFETTVRDLRRSSGDQAMIRAALFLFLNRAYEAHLDPDEIVELLGIANPNILSAAGYTGADEAAAMREYGILDPVISQVYESK